MRMFLRKHPWWILVGSIVIIQVVWPHNPWAKHILKEKALVEEKSKLITISYYYPHFNYFADIVIGTQEPKKEWMEGYYFGKPYIFHTYYKKAADLLPNTDAAHFLLAFCQYHRGLAEAAIQSYQRTNQLNPSFFWAYYNLGVIYFQQGDWARSAAMMNQALNTDERMTLESLFQSPFYRQILRHVPNAPEVMIAHLRDGQEKAALILANSLIKAGAQRQAMGLIQSVGAGSRMQGLWDKMKQKANKQITDDDMDQLLKEMIKVKLF